MSTVVTPMDVAHRVGTWAALFGLLAYVMNIGAWVGAADEKFAAAQTVEQKQDALILQANTMAVRQESMQKGIAKNEKAIEESKKEILAAIKEAHK